MEKVISDAEKKFDKLSKDLEKQKDKRLKEIEKEASKKVAKVVKATSKKVSAVQELNEERSNVFGSISKKFTKLTVFNTVNQTVPDNKYTDLCPSIKR